MSAQIAADLRAAADVLERDGWTQGSFTDSHGCHCVAGALEVATGIAVDPIGSARYLEAARKLGEHIGLGPDSLVMFSWNDTPGRTVDEVITALRAAADAAEQA